MPLKWKNNGYFFFFYPLRFFYHMYAHFSHWTYLCIGFRYLCWVALKIVCGFYCLLLLHARGFKGSLCCEKGFQSAIFHSSFSFSIFFKSRFMFKTVSYSLLYVEVLLFCGLHTLFKVCFTLCFMF